VQFQAKADAPLHLNGWPDPKAQSALGQVRNGGKMTGPLTGQNLGEQEWGLMAGSCPTSEGDRVRLWMTHAFS
jgi:hypothetical protein